MEIFFVILPLLIVILIPYFFGSIPFGLILTQIAGAGDIRAIGSGNIGATNVLRTGRKWLALATLLLDGLKSFIPVAIINGIGEQSVGLTPYYFALLAILGHMYPVWLKFKGGKGVATAIGAFLALNVWLGLGVIAIWLSVFAVTRISSLSALIAMALAPAIAFIFMDVPATLIILLISLLIFFKHKDNIKRLAKGKEPRFGRK